MYTPRKKSDEFVINGYVALLSLDKALGNTPIVEVTCMPAPKLNFYLEAIKQALPSVEKRVEAGRVFLVVPTEEINWRPLVEIHDGKKYDLY